MFQTKKQDKISEKNINETDISNLCDKEFKVIVIKMLSELRRMDEYGNTQQRDSKYKKVLKSSYRAEEYNN